MTDFLSEALNLAEKGFAVFPLKPRQKVPATAHGCKDATRDIEQIVSWWTEQPDCNIGIATGSTSGGLVVIDVDNDKLKGKTGSASLRTWEKTNGELPETVSCITGSGGYHFYYRSPEHYTNTVGIIPDVDVRAEGGYVVAPPSVHPNGSLYEWENDPADTLVRPETDVVRRFLATQKKKEQEERSADAPIPDGHRTNELIKLVGLLIDRGLSRSAIEAAVRAENEAKCVPPKTEQELQSEIFKAFDRGWVPTHPYRDDPMRMLPDPVPLNTVWEDTPPMAPVLIDGVLRQGHKMILSAPSKAGKSFALMQLAYAIAEGMNWFGSRCTQGRVLYINMEIDDPSFYNRFKSIYQRKGMAGAGNHIENITVWGLRGYSMPLRNLTEQIIDTAKHDYLAIIIDPLYKVMDGDENSNSDIGRMVGEFDKIARYTGSAVIYAHHFAKGTAGDRDTIDRGAGAGTFARDPDAILTMTQLDLPDEVNEVNTAWRVEYVLREFPNKEPYNVYWRYPVHEFDEQLNVETIETTSSRSAKQKEKKKAAKQKEQLNEIRAAVNAVMKDGKFTVSEFMKACPESWEITLNTAKNRLKAAGYMPTPPEKNGLPSYWVPVKK